MNERDMLYLGRRTPQRHRLRIYHDERQKIIDLLLEKRNSSLVARMVGRSRTLIARIAKEENIDLYGGCVLMEEEREIVALLKLGKTASEIGRQFERSKMTISNIAKSYGVSLPKGRRKSKE